VKIETGIPLHVPGAKISDFTDLETWKFARALRRKVYKITISFPSDEKYSLISQMRRAAVSVTANIAEGYGRYSYQENVQFCRLSRGSMFELRDHLTTALDAGYISKESFAELNAMAVSSIRLVNGYIRATKNLKSTTAGAGSERQG
jgi:four helix bundle protein